MIIQVLKNIYCAIQFLFFKPFLQRLQNITSHIIFCGFTLMVKTLLDSTFSNKLFVELFFVYKP